MRCSDCIFVDRCVTNESFDNKPCLAFIPHVKVSVILDFDTYNDLVKGVDIAKMRLKKIRKSRNRDAVESSLDHLEWLLKARNTCYDGGSDGD